MSLEVTDCPIHSICMFLVGHVLVLIVSVMFRLLSALVSVLCVDVCLVGCLPSWRRWLSLWRPSPQQLYPLSALIYVLDVIMSRSKSKSDWLRKDLCTTNLFPSMRRSAFNFTQKGTISLYGFLGYEKLTLVVSVT